MKKITLFVLLVVCLMTVACSQGSATAAPPAKAPQAIQPGAQPQGEAPAQPNTVTLQRGDYGRVLQGSGSAAIGGASPTQPQPTAPAAPTEAPKAEQAKTLTVEDFTSIGKPESFELQKDEKDRWAGLYMIFRGDLDIDAPDKSWAVVIQQSNREVKKVKKDSKGTLWLDEIHRPMSDALVKAIETAKASASKTAVSPAPQSQTAKPAPQVAAPTKALAYNGPWSVKAVLEKVGLNEQVLRNEGRLRDAEGRVAGFKIETSQQKFDELAAMGIKCDGTNNAIRSCWLPTGYWFGSEPAAAPVPSAPTAGPNGEPFTVGKIHQGYLEAIGVVEGVIDAKDHSKVVDSSNNAVAALIRVRINNVPVKSFDWDWVAPGGVTCEGKVVDTFISGQLCTVWVQEDNSHFAAGKTVVKEEKKESKKDNGCPTTVAQVKAMGDKNKPMNEQKNREGKVVGVQLDIDTNAQNKLKSCKITVQGSDGNTRTVWLE